MKKQIFHLPLISLALFASFASRAAEPTGSSWMEIDQIANAIVTSVAKRPEPVSQTAAAIYVITPDDLRRSGVTSIPETLRLVPGMEVGRVGSASWAISPRGFISPFADRMLVLMDGRSVFDPFFSGVYWDTQDYLLEDLSRIEVIRGPGGTIWGANAVNGVVNVISKPAGETQGLLLNTGAGTEERGFAGVRYGVKLGDRAHLRVYGKYDNHDSLVTPEGTDAADSWEAARGGFRADWQASEQNLLTLQGDLYHNDYHQTTFLPTVVPPYERTLRGQTEASGGNVLARWTHDFSDTSQLTVQSYWDENRRDALTYRVVIDTFDVDASHHFQLGQRNNVTWSLGYRLSQDRFREPIPEFMVDPSGATRRLYSAYLQDELALVPDKLRLTLGSKFEHNDVSGWEIQPTARLLWQMSEHHSVWGAVTRAVRAPSRSDYSLLVDFQSLPPGALGFNTVPVLFQGRGGSREAQEMTGFELGYRTQPLPRVSAEVTAFYNLYDQVFSLSQSPPIARSEPVRYLAIPVTSGNDASATAYGLDGTLTWQATEWWRLRANYSVTHLRVEVPAGKRTGGDRYIPQQFSLNSGWNLTEHWQVDAWLRYVGRVEHGDIPAYVTADLRLAWIPSAHWEVSIVGQNLLDNQHPEFGHALIEKGPFTEVQRSVYGKVTWRF